MKLAIFLSVVVVILISQFGSVGRKPRPAYLSSIRSAPLSVEKVKTPEAQANGERQIESDLAKTLLELKNENAKLEAEIQGLAATRNQIRNGQNATNEIARKRAAITKAVQFRKSPETALVPHRAAIEKLNAEELEIVRERARAALKLESQAAQILETFQN